MSTVVKGWEQVEHGYFESGWARRDGDTITFMTEGLTPLLPVWIEVGNQAIPRWVYVDTGCMKTAVARSVVEGAGVKVDELEPEDGMIVFKVDAGQATVRSPIRLCPGRILLYDGTVLLDGKFRVYDHEPPPEFRDFGADSTIGLDVFEHFVFTFDYTRAPVDDSVMYDTFEHDAVFSLTPRQKAR